MKANLKGKVALVTGGSKGIGKALALKLGENGADVAVNTRSPEMALEVVRQIEGSGSRSIWEQGDILSYGDMQRVVANTIARLGKVDILVTSGSPRPPGHVDLFHKIPPERYLEIIQVTMLARVYPIRAVVEHMMERHYGKIIVITTDAGLVPTPSESMVGASAAGLMFLTRQLGRELARHGIRINAISTTLTRDTPGWERFSAAKQAESTEVIDKAFIKLEQRVPFGLNRPEDIAELALYLAADESNQLSGRVISINGGLSFP